MNDSTVRVASQDADGFLFSRALRAVLGRIPLWLTTFCVLWLLACLPALLWYGELREVFATRYRPDEQVHGLDAIFRADHREQLAHWSAQSGRLGAALACLAALCGVFAAGGWLQVILERTQGHSLRRFLYGGARYFWRFLRVWLLVLAALALWRWLCYEWPWQELVLGRLLRVPASDYAGLESLDSELSALQVRWAQAALFALGFAWILGWGIYTRTRLALSDTRSAFLAGIASAWFLCTRPLRTMRPLLALFLLELTFLLMLGAVLRLLDARLSDTPSLTLICGLHALSQLGLLWRQITRGAHYYVAVQVSREALPQAVHSDAWKTIGGPGGPQYPVDGGADEYGVAL